MLELNKIYNLDIRDGLLSIDDKTIDMTITSPPYWGLRSYEGSETIWDGQEDCEHDWIEHIRPPKGGRYSPDNPPSVGSNKTIQDENMVSRFGYTSNFCSKCGAWRGQLGLEPTPDLYIKHLCDIYDDVKRVLKDEGTCWVNIGDTYSGSGKGAGYKGIPKESWSFDKKPYSVDDVPAKSLVMIPFRFALEMVNRGWILRNTIIWHKPNAMPTSVNDRFTVDFEYLFFFSKKGKYYFEQQFEDFASSTLERIKHKYNPSKSSGFAGLSDKQQTDYGEKIKRGEVKGRNMRTTWSISTKNFPGAHFATFPETLIEIPIKACCPEFICKKCGKPKTTKRIKTGERPINMIGGIKRAGGDNPTYSGNTTTPLWDYILTPNCECNAGFKAGIVLDPFMGAGTTGLMAKKLNRNYIGFEISKEYCDIANKRLEDIEQI